MTTLSLPSFDDIKKAEQTLKEAVYPTPLHPTPFLCRFGPDSVYCKLENLQLTGSFKARGAYNKLKSLSKKEMAAGVITASAGNHAQSVAYHAAKLGIAATIIMPVSTPFIKVTRTESFGAKVILYGQDLSESVQYVHELIKDQGLTLVHPYDDPYVIAGQGTIGLEIWAQQQAQLLSLDTIIVPIGGGGLISGVALAMKHLSPETRVIGVQTASYPYMYDAVKSGAGSAAASATPMPTIAEGIAVKRPGHLTTEMVKHYVDDIVLVSETAIERAIFLMAEEGKIVTEGAGAAGVAALIEHPNLFTNRHVGVVICGANIDTRLLSNVLMRGLASEHRVVRLRIKISDAAGSLAKLLDVISEVGASIIEIYHDRLSYQITAKSTEVEIVLEIQNKSHLDKLLAKLQSHSFVVQGDIING